MKTFNDLIFEPHPLGGIIAHLFFDNGRGISVVYGSWFYSNGVDTYEVAVLDEEGYIDYSTSITSDVLPHLTKDKVTEVMKQIQELE